MFPLRPDERTYFLTAAGILAAASIAILRMPLFNYLGYEFSAAIALLLPFITGPYTLVAFARRWPRGTAVTTRAFTVSVRDLFVQHAALLLIPFAAALASGIFAKNCSYGEGIAYYILLPGVTAVWLVGFAAFCRVLFRRPALWYAGAILLMLVHPLLLGYFTPAIHSYNVLYGYFPGLSYDESLRLTWRLMLFRYLSFLWAALFLLASEFIVSYRTIGQGFRGIPGVVGNLRFHRQGWIVMLAVAVQLGAGWLLRVPLGFESTSSAIERSLGDIHQTRHFDIVYDGGSIPPGEMRRIAAMHEFRYDQVRAALRVGDPGRIRSYLYPDAATKRRWIGAGNTDIAKPWRGEIHLNAEGWEGTLKHELVHVLAGEFGMPVIRANINTGLVEGLAMAIDDDFGNRTIDEYAASLIRFRLVEDPGALIRLSGFAVQSSSVSYVAMGSFCGYLIREFGIDAFKEVYGGASPDKAYGRPYAALLDAWKSSLEAVSVPEEWRAHVEYYFRRPSIFAKECARAVANRNEDASLLLAGKEYAQAFDAYRSALHLSWNSASYAGMIRSAFAAGRYDSVRQLMRARTPDSTRAGLTGLLLISGDAAWMRGDTAEARASYRTIIGLDLSGRSTESAALRDMALDDSLLSAQLPHILFGAPDDSAMLAALRRLQPGSPHPLLDYLEAKLLMRMGRSAAVPPLLGTIASALPAPLEEGKNRMMGESYLRIEEWDHAAAHFRKVAEISASGAARRAAQDDLERCAWLASHQEPPEEE